MHVIKRLTFAVVIGILLLLIVRAENLRFIGFLRWGFLLMLWSSANICWLSGGQIRQASLRTESFRPQNLQFHHFLFIFFLLNPLSILGCSKQTHERCGNCFLLDSWLNLSSTPQPQDYETAKPTTELLQHFYFNMWYYLRYLQNYIRSQINNYDV